VGACSNADLARLRVVSGVFWLEEFTHVAATKGPRACAVQDAGRADHLLSLARTACIRRHELLYASEANDQQSRPVAQGQFF
jgi:hypothetical protein